MVGREDNRFPIEITRVVDGDGFQAKVLDGSERTIDVRLYAIDAPESRQKYGREAANHLRQVVESGRSVAIVYKDSFDISHTLNYLMVRAGWAYWYSQYEDGDNELELREAEATAYMEGKGVWQEPDLERPWAYKARILQEREIIERDEAIEAALRDTYREAAELGVTGWTDLHAAASKGFGPKLQELLSNGLNPNSRDSIGRTPTTRRNLLGSSRFAPEEGSRCKH